MSPLRAQHLRQVGVVGKFVEFFGPGVAQLSIADRATIANMCPEYGATAAFFPVDAVSIRYLEQTGEPRPPRRPPAGGTVPNCLCLVPGRDPEKLASTRDYLKAVGMFRDYADPLQDPDFTQVGGETRRGPAAGL